MARMAAYTGKTVTWKEAMNSTQNLVPDSFDFDHPLPPTPVPIPGQTKFS